MKANPLRRLIAGITIAVILPTIARSQCDPCGGGCPAASPPIVGPVVSPHAGLDLPARGKINALVLFIDFEDETEDPANANWPLGAGPVGIGPGFLSQFIDLTPEQQSGRKFNITTYYRDMSFGALSIVGYPIYRRARRTKAAYEAHPTMQFDVPYWATREVLQSLTGQDVGG